MPRALGQTQQHPQPSPGPSGPPLPTVPPVIETGLPDLSATEGSHALLPCTARGSPKPDITWEKDGQPVSGTEEKFTIQPSGELLVKNSEVRAPPRSTGENNSTKSSKWLLGASFVVLCAERCAAFNPRNLEK